MEKCPIKIVLFKVASTGHALAFKTSAVVYRRLNGNYYIIIGKHRFPVTLAGHGFELKMSLWNWSRYFPPVSMENKHNVCKDRSEKPAAEGC